jgi:predicted DNA-binding ribbon-helix-helix protein
LGCTSIRLEMSFWDTLEEIAAKEEMSLAKFLTTLHNEVLDHHGEVNNFASLLRCSCQIYSRRPGLSWQRRGHSRRGRIDLGPM